VDKKSATLGLAGVRERQIPMDADYNSICKFASAEGDNYTQVSFNLIKLVRSAIMAVVEKERIALLGILLLNPLLVPSCTWILLASILIKLNNLVFELNCILNSYATIYTEPGFCRLSRYFRAIAKGTCYY
jgi:hypothetical protein